MIGNAVEAAKALSGELDYLGAGCWRRAYANELRTVVYKVTKHKNDDYMNQYEFANAFELQLRDDIPEFVCIPDVSLYTVEGRAIVAMPFVEGEALGYTYDYPHTEKFYEWVYRIGMRDMGGDNVRIMGGKAYVVDMGYRWTKP